MIKKIIVLLAGMLVTVAVYAAGAQLRADHPDSYAVRRGDTLWDISAKLLSKPWLWPEIWLPRRRAQSVLHQRAASASAAASAYRR